MRTVATKARCFLDAVKRWSQVKTPERKEGGVLLLYAKGSIEKTALTVTANACDLQKDSKLL